VALTIRLPARMRWPLAAVAVGLCVGGAAVAAGGDWSVQDGTVSELASGVVAAQARLAGFSTQRLTSELAGRYGFRFTSPTAAADPGSVDMATARDGAGNQLRVIVFGRAPEPVHGLVCEFTPAHAADTTSAPDTSGAATTPAEASAPAAAGFLAACAKLGAGSAQADAAVHWVAQAQAGLSAATAVQSDRGRLTAAARFATVGYVMRRLPETGEWIMVMSGENP
jgi:hypothetical protein